MFYSISDSPSLIYKTWNPSGQGHVSRLIKVAVNIHKHNKYEWTNFDKYAIEMIHKICVVVKIPNKQFIVDTVQLV